MRENQYEEVQNSNRWKPNEFSKYVMGYNLYKQLKKRRLAIEKGAILESI